MPLRTTSKSPFGRGNDDTPPQYTIQEGTEETCPTIVFNGNIGFNDWCSIPHQRRHRLSSSLRCIHYDCSTPVKQSPPTPCKNSVDCIRDFRRIEILRVTAATFQDMPDFTVIGSNLVTLRLEGCRMEIGKLLAFLRSFTRLGHLEISAPVFTRSFLQYVGFTQEEDTAVTEGTPLPIKELSLLGTPSGKICGDPGDPREKLKSFLALSKSRTLSVIRINEGWGDFDLGRARNLERVILRGSCVSELVGTIHTLRSLRKLGDLSIILPRIHIVKALRTSWWSPDWKTFNSELEEVLSRNLTLAVRLTPHEQDFNFEKERRQKNQAIKLGLYDKE